MVEPAPTFGPRFRRTGNVVAVSDTPPEAPASSARHDGPVDAPTDDRDDHVNPGEAADGADPVDLAAIERDLDAVEAALPRLDDGTYWVDERTGEPISDQVLAADPVARRA